MKVPVYGKLKKLQQDGMEASIGRLYMPLKDIVGPICNMVEKGKKTEDIRKEFAEKYLLVKPTWPENGVTWSIVSKLYNTMSGYKDIFQNCKTQGQASSMIIETFFNALEKITNEGRDPYFAVDVDAEEITEQNKETRTVTASVELPKAEEDTKGVTRSVQAQIEEQVVGQMDGFDIMNGHVDRQKNLSLLEQYDVDEPNNI